MPSKSIKKKTVIEHLQELIEFYSCNNIENAEYLKKLFVRNLKDVKKRAENEWKENKKK